MARKGKSEEQAPESESAEEQREHEERPSDPPASVTTEEPAPAPPQPLGPQRERRHRGAYFVESGVNQIVHVARQGDEARLKDLARRLLSQAYGL